LRRNRLPQGLSSVIETGKAKSLRGDVVERLFKMVNFVIDA